MVHSVGSKHQESPLKSVLFLLRSGSLKSNILLFALLFPMTLLLGLLEGSSYLAFLTGLSKLAGEAITSKYKFIEALPFSFIGWIFFGITLQLIKSVCSMFTAFIATIFFRRIQMNLQTNVMHHLTSMQYEKTLEYRSGELVQLVEYSINQGIGLLNHCYSFLQNIALCLAMLISMFFISIPLTITMLLSGGCVLYAMKVIKSKIVSYTTLLIKERDTIFSKLIELVANIKILHLFNLHDFFNQQSIDSSSRLGKLHSRCFFFSQVTPIISEFISILFIGLSFIIGKFLLVDVGDNLLPILVTFGGISYRFIGKLNATLACSLGISVQSIYISRISDFIKSSRTSTPIEEKRTIFLNEFTVHIACKDIGFQYPQNDKPAIKSFSMVIPKGKTVAVVGSSGGGKSTLINLLTGLYHPTRGQIMIDEYDLSEVNIGSWRRQIGVVNQENIVFNDTLRHNICLDNQDIDPILFDFAVRASKVADFAEKLTDKYETIIGERGFKLSGGEKQRVALARALIRQPQLLILDEATSHLDSISEKAIQEAINDLSGKITMLIVAHRLSTIRNADLIYVMENGCIVERGTHKELVHTMGAYSKLWHAQFSETLATKT